MLTPTPEATEAFWHDWSWWARPEQLAPVGDWTTWVVLAGRGFGKTRTGAEWVRQQLATGKSRIALVAATAADARDVMVEGESGLLAVYPPSQRPEYKPSLRRVTWPDGRIATTYSADEPDRLRGPQHDCAWADEVGAWRYGEALDMLRLGLRLGADPRLIVTTTPKPTTLIRRLIDDPSSVVTRGSTFDNAGNLSETFIAGIRKRYEGTRLGRQELYAEVLTDTPGALWTRANIDDHRRPKPTTLTRVVVAIDPAVSANENSDETGIVVVGVGEDGHGYVLEDLSCRVSPDAWARRAVDAYHRHRADRIVAEVNQGGDLVESVIRTVDRDVPYRSVRASRGKATRAEPVAALYEQARVHHCAVYDTLEDQMVTFVPEQSTASPDRVDALVWALTDLILAASEWHMA